MTTFAIKCHAEPVTALGDGTYMGSKTSFRYFRLQDVRVITLVGDMDIFFLIFC